MTFIRAPLVVEAGEGVDVLARIDGSIVAVRYGNQLGVAFHPELDDDDRVLEAFLAMGGAESARAFWKSAEAVRPIG